MKQIHHCKTLQLSPHNVYKLCFDVPPSPLESTQNHNPVGIIEYSGPHLTPFETRQLLQLSSVGPEIDWQRLASCSWRTSDAWSTCSTFESSSNDGKWRRSLSAIGIWNNKQYPVLQSFISHLWDHGILSIFLYPVVEGSEEALLFAPHREPMPTDGEVPLPIDIGIGHFPETVRGEELTLHGHCIVQVNKVVAHKFFNSNLYQVFNIDDLWPHLPVVKVSRGFVRAFREAEIIVQAGRKVGTGLGLPEEFSPRFHFHWFIRCASDLQIFFYSIVVNLILHWAWNYVMITLLSWTPSRVELLNTNTFFIYLISMVFCFQTVKSQSKQFFLHFRC